MWLHPGHRGARASPALLAAVRNWALRDGATTLMLWVTRSNHAAARLYRRAGFSETGACMPLPSNPALIQDPLALEWGIRRRLVTTAANSRVQVQPRMGHIQLEVSAT